MRILFLTTEFAPYELSEGIVNSKLVFAFIKEGWQVDVFSRHISGQFYTTSYDESWGVLKTIVHRVTYSNNALNKYLDAFMSILKFKTLSHGSRWAYRTIRYIEKTKVVTNYDLIISRSPSDIPHLLGYYIKRKYEIPWVANWDDPAESIWPEMYKIKLSFFQIQINRLLINRCIKYADYLTFPCEELKDYFITNFPKLNQCKIMIIPHIAHPGFNSQKVFMKNKIFSIGHAGNLTKERNPIQLLNALKQISQEIGKENISLSFIGNYDNSMFELAKKLGISECIFFKGKMRYHETLYSLINYDLLLLIEAPLSYGYFLPSKLTDYIQASHPILAISPKRGCVNNLFLKFGGGLVSDNKSEDSLLNSLRLLYELWKNNKLQNEYKTTELFNYFSPQNVLKLYLELFNNLKINNHSKN